MSPSLLATLRRLSLILIGFEKSTKSGLSQSVVRFEGVLAVKMFGESCLPDTCTGRAPFLGQSAGWTVPERSSHSIHQK